MVSMMLLLVANTSAVELLVYQLTGGSMGIPGALRMLDFLFLSVLFSTFLFAELRIMWARLPSGEKENFTLQQSFISFILTTVIGGYIATETLYQPSVNQIKGMMAAAVATFIQHNLEQLSEWAISRVGADWIIKKSGLPNRYVLTALITSLIIMSIHVDGVTRTDALVNTSEWFYKWLPRPLTIEAMLENERVMLGHYMEIGLYIKPVDYVCVISNTAIRPFVDLRNQRDPTKCSMVTVGVPHDSLLASQLRRSVVKARYLMSKLHVTPGIVLTAYAYKFAEKSRIVVEYLDRYKRGELPDSERNAFYTAFNELLTVLGLPDMRPDKIDRPHTRDDLHSVKYGTLADVLNMMRVDWNTFIVISLAKLLLFYIWIVPDMAPEPMNPLIKLTFKEQDISNPCDRFDITTRFMTQTMNIYGYLNKDLSVPAIELLTIRQTYEFGRTLLSASFNTAEQMTYRVFVTDNTISGWGRKNVVDPMREVIGVPSHIFMLENIARWKITAYGLMSISFVGTAVIIAYVCRNAKKFYNFLFDTDKRTIPDRAQAKLDLARKKRRFKLYSVFDCLFRHNNINPTSWQKQWQRGTDVGLGIMFSIITTWAWIMLDDSVFKELGHTPPDAVLEDKIIWDIIRKSPWVIRYLIVTHLEVETAIEITSAINEYVGLERHMSQILKDTKDTEEIIETIENES